MKKARSTSSRRVDPDADTMRPEYDFSNAVRGVTAVRYAEAANVILVDPDLARVFPNAKAVNDALRTLARIRRRPAVVRWQPKRPRCST